MIYANLDPKQVHLNQTRLVGLYKTTQTKLIN
jgi:hypothetical protein